MVSAPVQVDHELDDDDEGGDADGDYEQGPIESGGGRDEEEDHDMEEHDDDGETTFTSLQGHTQVRI